MSFDGMGVNTVMSSEFGVKSRGKNAEFKI